MKRNQSTSKNQDKCPRHYMKKKQKARLKRKRVRAQRRANNG